MKKEEETKEDCWLCHKQLPYADYWYLLRDADDKVSALEPHTVLMDDQCLELKLEFIYSKREYAPLAKDPVVFLIFEGYVHKKCGESVRNYQQMKSERRRCTEFALIGKPIMGGAYADYLTQDACIKVTKK